MTAEDIREHLGNLIGAITFEYNGKNCGIDPLSLNKFEMWYGDDETVAESVDEVMSIDFFDGNCLEEIIEDVEDFEY